MIVCMLNVAVVNKEMNKHRVGHWFINLCNAQFLYIKELIFQVLWE